MPRHRRFKTDRKHVKVSEASKERLRKVAPANSLDNNRLVKVTLRNQHTRNGEVYGPGELRLTRALARELSNEEERGDAADAAFLGTRGVVIGPKGKHGTLIHTFKQVPLETFDTDPNMDTFEPAIVDPHRGG